MNKIDKLTADAADVTSSLIAAPFKFVGRVWNNLTRWI